MRKTLVTALALLSCVGMLACGGDSSSLKDSLKEPTKKPSSSYSNSNNNYNNDDTNDQQDSFWESYGDESEGTKENPLFSFQVTEEGETCQFPCWYVELEDTEANEWICTEYDDEMVQPGELVSIEGDDKVLLVHNDTSKPQEALYCTVVGIRYTKDYFELIDPAWGIVDVRLPENLKVMTAAKADITAAYGTPTKVETEGSYEVLLYEAGENKYAALYLENDVLCEFELCNVDTPANNLAMSTDALYSFTFSINGENYQFPLTAEELVFRGWDPGFDIYTEQVECYYMTDEIIWEKDGIYLETNFMKEGEEDTLLTECDLCYLEIGRAVGYGDKYKNPSNMDVRLPNGVRLFESKQGAIFGAYGSPTEYESQDDPSAYYFAYDLEDADKLDENCALVQVALLVDDEEDNDTLYAVGVSYISEWMNEMLNNGGSEA